LRAREAAAGVDLLAPSSMGFSMGLRVSGSESAPRSLRGDTAKDTDTRTRVGREPEGCRGRPGAA
jgi:hypothetical protein